MDLIRTGSPLTTCEILAIRFPLLISFRFRTEVYLTKTERLRHIKHLLAFHLIFDPVCSASLVSMSRPASAASAHRSHPRPHPGSAYAAPPPRSALYIVHTVHSVHARATARRTPNTVTHTGSTVDISPRGELVSACRDSLNTARSFDSPRRTVAV
jgi:hypothetical protein